MSDEDEPIGPTLLLKLPFLILGILIGMAVVWLAFQWVPDVVLEVSAKAGFTPGP